MWGDVWAKAGGIIDSGTGNIQHCCHSCVGCACKKGGLKLPHRKHGRRACACVPCGCQGTSPRCTQDRFRIHAPIHLSMCAFMYPCVYPCIHVYIICLLSLIVLLLSGMCAAMWVSHVGWGWTRSSPPACSWGTFPCSRNPSPLERNPDFATE